MPEPRHSRGVLCPSGSAWVDRCSWSNVDGGSMDFGERFDPNRHISNVLTGREVRLLSSDKSILPGIVGVPGCAELIGGVTEIGVDRIIMESGARFELHTHPGAHILYVMRSRGFIHIDGVDYEIGAGDTVFVPADYAHGVKTNTAVTEPFELLAFGVPHMPLESPDRMTLVTDPARAASRSV
ncbi:cupin domain-containing protein [Micromonospora sp. CPCC 206060]|uniref:cupin domain-containing protein n=1 Tax=Micromonospora sp. CPCC 206060 TaxID=3122406 RepID=UPI002FF23D24